MLPILRPMTRQLRDIDEPDDKDVLFGKGAHCNHHEGSKKWRNMIKDRLPEYFDSKRKDKPELCLKIVGEWRANGGRFLMKNKDGKWDDIGDKEAKTRTGQRFRDQERSDRTQPNQMARSGKGSKKATLIRNHTLGSSQIDETEEGFRPIDFGWVTPFKANDSLRTVSTCSLTHRSSHSSNLGTPRNSSWSATSGDLSMVNSNHLAYSSGSNPEDPRSQQFPPMNVMISQSQFDGRPQDGGSFLSSHQMLGGTSNQYNLEPNRLSFNQDDLQPEPLSAGVRTTTMGSSERPKPLPLTRGDRMSTMDAFGAILSDDTLNNSFGTLHIGDTNEFDSHPPALDVENCLSSHQMHRKTSIPRPPFLTAAKRDTSNQHLQHKPKRPSYNRDESFTTNRLKQHFMPGLLSSSQPELLSKGGRQTTMDRKFGDCELNISLRSLDLKDLEDFTQEAIM